MLASSIVRAAGSSSKTKVPTSKLVQKLTTGTGATRLVPHVKSLRLNVYPKPRGKGEREFIKTILPRIALANPHITVNVSYYEQVKKEQKKNLLDSTSAPSDPAEAEAEAQAAEESAESADAKPEREPCTLTIEFANIPARKVTMDSKEADAIAKEIFDAARAPDQSELADGIPRPIGYDPVVEAARAKAEQEAAAAAAEQEKIRAAKEAEEMAALRAANEAAEQQSQGVQPEEPAATNLTGSAEGLSDVEGVGKVVQRE